LRPISAGSRPGDVTPVGADQRDIHRDSGMPGGAGGQQRAAATNSITTG
jgi:hypothetical protein